MPDLSQEVLVALFSSGSATVTGVVSYLTARYQILKKIEADKKKAETTEEKQHQKDRAAERAQNQADANHFRTMMVDEIDRLRKRVSEAEKRNDTLLEERNRMAEELLVARGESHIQAKRIIDLEARLANAVQELQVLQERYDLTPTRASKPVTGSWKKKPKDADD
jgi:chromosome segregation ATPase